MGMVTTGTEIRLHQTLLHRLHRAYRSRAHLWLINHI